MEINDKLIEHLCFLGRISLKPADREQLKQDLSKILSYIETLNKVDVSNVKPLVHSGGEAAPSNVYREDKADGRSLPSARALQNAPQKRGNFFEVPRVIE